MLKNREIYNIIFSDLQEQQRNLIEGSLLGDGCVHKVKNSNKNACLTIQRQAKDLEYLTWQANVLYNLLRSTIKKLETLDKRTDKIYTSHYFSTIASKLFTDLYIKWYPDRIKIVPKDLQLNNEIISIWFCDDGCVSIKDKPYTFELQLATNAFALKDVVFLTEQLRHKYYENFFITKGSNNQFIIRGGTDATRALLYDIDPIFPDSMNRKAIIWRNDSACFYDKIPKRTKREKDIIDFIMANDGFTQTELGIGIEAYVIRKDRNNTKAVLYHFITPYIKKYIQNNYLIEWDKRFYLTEVGKQLLPFAHFTELKYK